ncbi:MAG TPA: hypothetical protein VN131_00575 [Mobilitalea sp.]|nr:hypothetical protein [Mobilitalea sp.]
MITKKKVLLFIGLFFLIIIIFFTIKMLKEKSTLNKNKETIRIVNEQIFTCPNNDIISLYNDMLNTTENKAQSTPGLGVVDSTELDKKLYEMYSNYISSEWFESFRTKYYSKFYVYSIASEYEMKVHTIDIVQSKKIPTNYSFTIYLTYGPKDGVKKDTEVEGSAQLTNEGKISFITFFDKNLYKEFRSSL